MLQHETFSSVHSVYETRVYENQGLSALTSLVRPEERDVLDIGCGDGAKYGRIACARPHSYRDHRLAG